MIKTDWTDPALDNLNDHNKKVILIYSTACEGAENAGNAENEGMRETKMDKDGKDGKDGYETLCECAELLENGRRVCGITAAPCDVACINCHWKQAKAL